MIFVTVGTQLPFDRLVRAVDGWAGRQGCGEVIGQIGPGTYLPQHMQSHETMTPSEFARAFAQSRLVVAHAGIGTILHALKTGKPLLVMPRRFALGEHRNDHQVATVEHFQKFESIHVASNESELEAILDKSSEIVSENLEPTTVEADPRLLARIRAAIG